jgi:hypothetical protein
MGLSGISLRIFAGILKAALFEKLGSIHKFPIKKKLSTFSARSFTVSE